MTNASLPFPPATPAAIPSIRPDPERRYLAVSLPLIPTDRIARTRWGADWRARGRPDIPPVVIAGKRDNAMRLVAVDEMAAQAGLIRGQSLSDARAMYPDIEVLGEDETADRIVVEAIADWCDRYTPLVSVEAADDRKTAGLMLDITGCAHLFGGEKALVDDLLARLFHQGFAAKAAIAATPGGAWALARFGPAGGGEPCRFVPAAETVRALAPLPLAALRLSEEALAGLARVGLRMVGQVMARPRGPLARRFGREILLRLDQAVGSVEEAISPRLPTPELMAERRLAEPVASTEAIEMLTERLAGHLCEDLERRGLGARLVDLVLFRVDGHVTRIGVGMSRPLREAVAIRRLFAERLAGLADEFDAGYGFDMIRLSVAHAERMEAQARQFLSGPEDAAQVGDLVDRLAARLGMKHVLVAVPRNTHLPERAEQLQAACSTFSGTIRLDGKPDHGDPGAGTGLPAPDTISSPPVLRPLRLFDRPEPVEAMAQVPDGPPVRFRWRRVLHEIARAEGPERIADEWWHEGDGRHTRDYFRIEDRLGRRFWLFREGLYGTESNAPRWYVHGMFA